MSKDTIDHLIKLPLDEIDEPIDAEPRVAHSEEEIEQVLSDLKLAVENKSYIPQTPTQDNPALSDDYIFDTNDENMILLDLNLDNFVGKIRDLSKGAKKRKANGFPEEYLYVFKYPCRLIRRDAQISGVKDENVLIYIKVNDRKIPYKRVFVVSFHKNKPKK